MDKKLLLVLNPAAGQRRANRWMPEIIRVCIDAGFRCETFVTAQRGEATQFVQAHAGEFDRVVCIGGDGTLNETIAGVMASEADVPLGYIPAGSTNDYAASLGLSSDCLQAARDAVSCDPMPFDLGCFNGRYFTYTASCGAFTRASYSAPQNVKNTLGHLAYILEGIRDLSSLHPYPMRVEANGQVYEDEFLFLSVTNSTSVGGILKLDARRVALNDGSFEVMLIRNPRSAGQLSSIVYALSTMEIPSDMVHFFSSPQIVVDGDEQMEWTLDGEHQSGAKHIEIENKHSVVRIAVNPNASAAEIEARA